MNTRNKTVIEKKGEFCLGKSTKPEKCNFKRCPGNHSWFFYPAIYNTVCIPTSSNHQFLNINFNHKWTVYGAIGNQGNAARLVQVEREPKWEPQKWRHHWHQWKHLKGKIAKEIQQFLRNAIPSIVLVLIHSNIKNYMTRDVKRLKIDWSLILMIYFSTL